MTVLGSPVKAFQTGGLFKTGFVSMKTSHVESLSLLVKDSVYTHPCKILM